MSYMYIHLILVVCIICQIVRVLVHIPFPESNFSPDLSRLLILLKSLSSLLTEFFTKLLSACIHVCKSELSIGVCVCACVRVCVCV